MQLINARRKHVCQLFLMLLAFITCMAHTGTVNQLTTFNKQLIQLINGLKDEFEELKGEKIDLVEHRSKIQLEGAVTTSILTDTRDDVSVFAFLGGFATMEEAIAVYQNYIAKIDAAINLPVPIVKQKESSSATTRKTLWLVKSSNADTDPTHKNFTLTAEVSKGFKNDKVKGKIDTWYAVIKLDNKFR